MKILKTKYSKTLNELLVEAVKDTTEKFTDFSKIIPNYNDLFPNSSTPFDSDVFFFKGEIYFDILENKIYSKLPIKNIIGTTLNYPIQFYIYSGEKPDEAFANHFKNLLLQTESEFIKKLSDLTFSKNSLDKLLKQIIPLDYLDLNEITLNDLSCYFLRNLLTRDKSPFKVSETGYLSAYTELKNFLQKNLSAEHYLKLEKRFQEIIYKDTLDLFEEFTLKAKKDKAFISEIERILELLSDDLKKEVVLSLKNSSKFKSSPELFYRSPIFYWMDLQIFSEEIKDKQTSELNKEEMETLKMFQNPIVYFEGGDQYFNASKLFRYLFNFYQKRNETDILNRLKEMLRISDLSNFILREELFFYDDDLYTSFASIFNQVELFNKNQTFLFFENDIREQYNQEKLTFINYFEELIRNNLGLIKFHYIRNQNQKLDGYLFHYKSDITDQRKSTILNLENFLGNLKIKPEQAIFSRSLILNISELLTDEPEIINKIPTVLEIKEFRKY